jgi:hypothetical protein
MIKRLALIIIAVCALFVPLRALAEEGGNTLITRDDRLSKAAIEQQIVLDDVSKSIIQNKCRASQDIVKGIQDKTDMLVRKRLILYSDIQKELQAIKLRMIRQGADASETDLLTGRLQQSLDNFTIQANKYGLALDDTINVDCINKPEQFRAALFILKVQRAKLLDLSLELKNTMANSQSNVFDQLKKRLVI